MPWFTLKMDKFSSISLENPKYVLKQSEQDSFFKTIDLRDHIPRFTLKMNVFPSISLETT